MVLDPIEEPELLTCSATVSSEIISPACGATMVAPTMVSVPFRQCTLTKPPSRSSPSQMARSLPLRFDVYVSSVPSSACARSEGGRC